MQKIRVTGAGLLVASLFAGASPAWAATPGTSPSSTQLVRSARLADTAVPRQATDLGAYNAASPVSFEVVLASSDPSGEATLARAEYDPSSPLFHHWLSPSAFNAEFGPSAATVAAAKSWLKGKGLTARRSSEFALSISAPSGRVAGALGVSFERYRLKGHVGYAPRSAPLVPRGVEAQVAGFVGLNTVEVPQHTNSAQMRPKPAGATTAGNTANQNGCAAANNAASSGPGETMLTEARTYGVNTFWNNGLQGRGQTIGIFELANFQGSDITAFEHCFGLDVPVKPVYVGSNPGTDLLYGGTAEADLDIEEAAQQAPQSSILVYEADDSSGDPSVLYNLWNGIVSADAVQTISTSWGSCEPDDDRGGTGFDRSINGLLEQATIQGQSVFAAAGDAGSEDCAYDYIYYSQIGQAPPSYWKTASVDYPGASPWVTSVGGTQFVSSTSNVVLSSNLEAWNDCYPSPPDQNQDTGSACMQGSQAAYHAGGGGVSEWETSPSWQQSYFTKAGYGANRSASACAGYCRQVPDVSAEAGYPIVSYGPDVYNTNCPGNAGNICSDFNLGVGTSYGSPFMAGLVASRNSGCRTSTGNFGALVYGLASSATGYQNAFLDVTTGNNDMINHYNGADYPAAAGFDMATGLGTPVPGGIACPEVTSVTASPGGPTVGSAAAGTQVTVNGLGLESADIFFGGARAALVPNTATATSVTVTVPQVNAAGDPAVVTVGGALNGVNGTLTVPLTITGTSTSKSGCPDATGMSLQGAVGVAAVTVNGCPGYFVADAEGRVAAFGAATTHGDLSQVRLGSPIAGITATADGLGYYMFASRGGIFTYGDAVYHGSAATYGPDHPIVGLAVKPDGSGYWMVESNGGLFAFNVPFYGSMGGQPMQAPITGMAVAPSGSGYWMVSTNGGVFAFHASFVGSLGGHPPAKPIVGMSGTPSGNGYTLVGTDGRVYDFNAPDYGQPASPPGSPVVDLSPTPADDGYYEVTAAGGVFAYGPGATYFGRV